MKKFVNKILKQFGYEMIHYREDQFEIAGIKYAVDRCSVGNTPQGERAGLAVARMIQERNLKQLKVLDLCCGVGIVGLTMYSKLRQTDHLAQVCFSDINIFNINSLKRVLSLNRLDAEKFPCWLSDGLHSVPPDSAFDLIISSPPNFIIEDFMKELSPGRLGGFDPQWEFHRQFYAQCDKYLSDRGETWFNENADGATEETFLPYIRSNPALEYTGSMNEPLIPGFFWMKTKKVSQ